jgi:hypothetical protein
MDGFVRGKHLRHRRLLPPRPVAHAALRPREHLPRRVFAQHHGVSSVSTFTLLFFYILYFYILVLFCEKYFCANKLVLNCVN